MLRIHRSHPDDGFTIIPNGLLQDERLSWAARGLLMEVLSRPEGWETNADALWRKAKRSRKCQTPEGRGIVRTLFAELEQLGYITRTQVSVGRGQIATVVDVYDTPDHGDSVSWGEHGDRGTATRASVIRSSAVRASARRSSLERTEQQETEVQRLREKDSSSLADTRAAAASASARDRESELRAFYDAVDSLDDKTLRNALVTFENKRPRIYRQCRRSTAAQYDAKDKRLLKSEERARLADSLSYKYALRHYYDTADDWPAWLTRPLGWPMGEAA